VTPSAGEHHPSDFEPRSNTLSLISEAQGVRAGLKVGDSQIGQEWL